MHSHELQDKEQRIVELNEAEKIEPFRRCKWVVGSASYETTASPGASNTAETSH